MNYKLVNYSARNCKKIIPSNLLTSIAAAGTKANTQQIPPINRCQTPSILGHWSPEEVGPRLRKNIWWMFCNSWMGSMWWERGFARWSSFWWRLRWERSRLDRWEHRCWMLLSEEEDSLLYYRNANDFFRFRAFSLPVPGAPAPAPENGLDGRLRMSDRIVTV